MPKSKQQTAELQRRLDRLKQSYAQVSKQCEEMWAEIKTWPVEMVESRGQKFKGQVVKDEQLDRVYSDSLREKGRIAYEIVGMELLLNPRKGRPQEALYNHAQRDRRANPHLTVRQLAEKYLPEYFKVDGDGQQPRADFAVAMMEQALLRRSRKHRPTK